MADLGTIIDKVTVIPTAWNQDVNDAIYGAAGSRFLDTLDPLKGAGLMAFSPILSYDKGSVGARLAATYSVQDAPWETPSDGVASSVADITAADTAAVTAGKCLVFSPGIYLIDSNLTINSPCYFEYGAVLKVATGITLLFTQPASQRWALPRQIFNCVGTGKVQWLDCSPTVYPDWWTSNAAPGTTAMYAALQASYDCVVNGADSYCPSKTSGGAGRATVLLVTKTYRTATVLDCTQRDDLQIIAVGKATILSDSTGYIADFSSAYNCYVKGVEFISYTATVGILFNRCTSNPYTLYNNFENVKIYVGTNTAANGGQGTYGIVNCRAEQNVWKNSDIRADVPAFITQNPNGSFPPTSGTQDMVIVSCVVGTFIAVNFLRHTKHNYVMILDQILSFRFINCYWATVSTATGSNPYAIFIDTISGCEFSGVLEGTQRFMFVSKTSYFLDINLTPQVAALDNGGIINYDSANNTGMVNSKTKVNITAALAGGSVHRWSGAGPSFQFFGNQIYTGDSALITACSFSATNASVANVDVYTNETTPPTVASAAALTLPIGTRIAFISGVAAVTSLTALGFAGRTVTLVFQGILTFTDGGNLKLAGNFVTTADDTITLLCDGTNWYEQSRSVN